MHKIFEIFASYHVFILYLNVCQRKKIPTYKVIHDIVTNISVNY